MVNGAPLAGITLPAHADEGRMACLAFRINGARGEGCALVARYGRVVVILYANIFEGRWLSQHEYQRIVTTMATRIVKALTTTPLDPTPTPERDAQP